MASTSWSFSDLGRTVPGAVLGIIPWGAQRSGSAVTCTHAWGTVTFLLSGTVLFTGTALEVLAFRQLCPAADS